MVDCIRVVPVEPFAEALLLPPGLDDEEHDGAHPESDLPPGARACSDAHDDQDDTAVDRVPGEPVKASRSQLTGRLRHRRRRQRSTEREPCGDDAECDTDPERHVGEQTGASRAHRSRRAPAASTSVTSSAACTETKAQPVTRSDMMALLSRRPSKRGCVEAGSEIGDDLGHLGRVGVLVHRVPAAFEHDESGVGHLAFEVLAGARVLGAIVAAGEHQGRRRHVGDAIHHDRVLLQVQPGDTFGHPETMSVTPRACVPTFALLRVAEAGPGVEHDDAATGVRSRRCMRQSEVPAQRVADEHRNLVQRREHVIEVGEGGIACVGGRDLRGSAIRRDRGRSTARTSWRSASRSATASHVVADMPRPWIMTMGGPEPRRVTFNCTSWTVPKVSRSR